jgi:hypothetical protein
LCDPRCDFWCFSCRCRSFKNVLIYWANLKFTPECFPDLTKFLQKFITDAYVEGRYHDSWFWEFSTRLPKRIFMISRGDSPHLQCATAKLILHQRR